MEGRLGLLRRARLSGFFQFDPVSLRRLRLLTYGSTSLAVTYLHHRLGIAGRGNISNVLDEARQDRKAVTRNAQSYFCAGPHDAFDLMICVVRLVDEYCEIRDADDTCNAGTASDRQ